MKDKISVSKLIKKKYKDNTLELQDLFEEIDLVLNESDQSSYHSKVVRNGVSDSIPENQESENISYRINGPATTRNPKAPKPGYNGRAPGNVIPDKITEKGPAQDISLKTESISVDIPDIFSLVTNSQMGLGAENDKDRQLIDKIIKRMDVSGRRNWITRIQSMQRFIDDETGKAKQFKGDIRTAVANLIFLNLIKKISYSIAQPGKLFEYIIAPLISSTARVVGSKDESIVDVTKTFQGSPGSYSIKFFTGDTPGIDIVGSRENLTSHIQNTKTPVTYIVASVDKQAGIIQFAELLVTTDQNWFVSDGNWRTIQGKEALQHGAILTSESRGVTRFGIWVNQTGLPTPIAANKIDRETEIPAEFAQTAIVIPFFNNELKIARGKTTLLNELINSVSKVQKVTELETLLNKKFNSLNNIKNIKETINENNFEQFKGLLVQALKDLNIGIRQSFSRKPQQVQNALIELSRAFEDKIKEEYKKLIPISPQEPTLEEQQAKKEGTQFSIPLQGSWLRLSKIQLNLGKPEDFKKAQLNVASELATDMKNTLAAYKNLSTNIVGFFATTQEDNEVNYGSEAIKNAEDIKNGVSGFVKKEKSGIK